MYTIATFKSNTLCILALIVIMICVFAFGFLFQIIGFLLSGSPFQFSDPTVGVIIGAIVGISLGLPIAYYDTIKRKTKRHKVKTALEQQTKFICPRCKILVNKNPGICPQCNQKI